MTDNIYYPGNPYRKRTYSHSDGHSYDHSYGSLSEPEAPCYKVISEEKRASDAMLRETAELLRGIVLDKYTTGSLSDRVFGNQIRQGKAGVLNSQKLIAERGRLLSRHIREIDERRNEVISRLDAFRRPYTFHRPQDVARVEKQLLDLDSARRDEYLDFWRDLAGERKELLESAGEYKASRDRADILNIAEDSEDSEDSEETEEPGEAEDYDV